MSQPPRVPGALLRAAGRRLLLAWARTNRAPGWRYEVIERWGASLAEPTPLLRTLVNGCTLRCDLTDEIQRHIYFGGLYEPVETWLLLRLLEPGATFLDVGANVGQYTVLASTAVGPEGRVFSFEPVAPTFARLDEHVRANGLRNVRLSPWALWDGPDTLRLGLPAGVQPGGNAGAYSAGATNAAGIESCQAVALDAHAEALGIAHVDFVKMDIEGAELRALRGMRQLIERDRPTLMIEINRPTLASCGATPEMIWSLLGEELGYRGWVVNPLPGDSGPLTDLTGIYQRNVFFFPGAVPAILSEGWDYKRVLRWALG